MKAKDKKPLQVALYGMDGRSYKTMVMYLQGPCNGAAVVVEDIDAEIDIIDADYPTAREILEQRKQSSPDRPIIAMSLENLQLENSIFLKKPIKRESLLTALEQAKTLARKQSEKTLFVKPSMNGMQSDNKDRSGAVAQATVESSRQSSKKTINEEERKKTAKHQTAKQYNEGGFSTFIGVLPDIDFNNQEQVRKAVYNPLNFYQGYVKSAFKVAKAKARVVQLNSGWKPLLIFPQSHEVWLDADDMQLRAFAGITINNSSGSGMSLSPINLKEAQNGGALDKFLSMDAFIWKLTLWTSKGRYPSNLDIDKPVFLKRWPNMTRLVNTPHALRIAALLIREPRPLMNIAEVLNIKPQYVFVFVSACHALDLLGQAERKADQMVAPENIKATQSSGLFNKILSKLRAAKSAE
ncbi:hypothetical protein Q9L42_011260 [Methylomarinum sp. Ch1-1]|uniref:Uncharacterized protein n=1 Tax=Methylomarinum roseum TaxID=3067653 RepID=A0AAU7NPQ4_9GAMM|nr:hypothetical protein [Methylomarinum sp. Ch1-1]MDP4521124.1 hypothetical protein [Methylomarinum sp. Ch1-1]